MCHYFQNLKVALVFFPDWSVGTAVKSTKTLAFWFPSQCRNHFLPPICHLWCHLQPTYWIWPNSKRTNHLIDKANLGKMGGVYVTYVTNADKVKWHVEHWYIPCIFNSQSFTAIHVEPGIETLGHWDTWKLLGIGSSPLLWERLCYLVKNSWERREPLRQKLLCLENSSF